MGYRTDLAIEEHEQLGGVTELKGITSSEIWLDDIKITRVEICDEKAATELSKPKGKYVTIEFDNIAGDAKKFTNLVEKCAFELKTILNPQKNDTVLVVGLGNAYITPDALGPKSTKNIIATRHIKDELKNVYNDERFLSVAVLTPGVLGQTGIETSEIIKGVVNTIKPSAVIVIDALMSGNLNRLAKTIQISDSGIIPGGGINNARAKISKDELSVPVISIGVPTVVDAATIAADAMEQVVKTVKSSSDVNVQILNDFSTKEKQELVRECLNPYDLNLIVTPKDIDFFVDEISKVVGFCINKSVHDDVSIEEMQSLIS